jgi:nitrite reductase/ring-hydroxylating ferredoxin subunit
MVTAEHEGSVVAVAMLGGTLHAFDDTCPHAGCSLAEGELDGQTVVCPCHLATFDVTTGAVVSGPAPSGVCTWSVRVADGAFVLGEPRDPEPPAGKDPDGGEHAGPSPDARPDTDVTVLVEREHAAMRRQFDAIEALTDAQELTTAWATVRELLEIHASAEESILYPNLARAADEGAEEAEHAVRDHNDIRESVRAVEEHPVGGPDWWSALRRAREVNDEHLQEEEREPLPLLRENTDRGRREELGREWLDFHEQHRHARGLTGDDAEPRQVVEGRS